MRHIFNLLTLAVTVVLLTTCNSSVENHAGSLSLEELIENFDNPPVAYKAKPFWSWNGKLKEHELKRQIEVMEKMGFGGFFMHSRTGLETEYLGDEWFNLTRSCTEMAKEKGLEAWLYDEDRWPSGLAGGIVTKNPEYRLKFVSLYTPEPNDFKWNDSIIAVFTAQLDSIRITNVHQVDSGADIELKDDETLLVFVEEIMNNNSFYNGYTYLNTMKREATDEFLRVTHEKYKQECGDEFGRTIKGIFTDEPHRGAVFTGFGTTNKNYKRMTPWTDGLNEIFEERFGYQLSAKLPELFFRLDGEIISQVKWQYMELIQQLYLENFAQPLYQWCENNNMLLTGHALQENSLIAQSIMQGSLMRNYEFMHYPGIDMLWPAVKHYWMAKQLSSVGRQLEKPFLLTETYGITGWHMNFEKYKAIGDWQALYGVNLRCPHLSWYTMKGEAKRDYPASILHQSAWWKEFSYLEDYYSRMGFMLSQGKPICDLLVVNPIETVNSQMHAGWGRVLYANGKEVLEVEKHYEKTFNILQEAKIDFDYADEAMMPKLCQVAENKEGQAILKMGAMSYKTVLITGIKTIRASTLEILESFQKAGGKVVFAGAAPEYVDAVKSYDALEVAKNSIQVEFDPERIVKLIKNQLGTTVEVLDEKGNNIPDIFVQQREDGNRQYFMLMNLNREKKFANCTVKIKTNGYVSEWNCATTNKERVKSWTMDGYQAFITDFEAVEEHLYVVTPDIIKKWPVIKHFEMTDTIPVLDSEYEYTLSEPNICVLDLARYSIEGKVYNKEEEVLKIDQAIRDFYKLPHRSGRMVQPWYRKKHGPEYMKGGEVQLHFNFNIEDIPSDSVFLCLEDAQRLSLKVNGKDLIIKTSGWFIDIAFEKVWIPITMLISGENTISVSFDFEEDMGIEAMYLIGNFGIKLDGPQKILTKLPEKITANDLTAQHLPFYTGRITYHVPLPKKQINSSASEQADSVVVCVNVPKYEGAYMKIDNKMVAWHPYEAIIDIADKKTIDIEVTLTRRNTFGPLHLLPRLETGITPRHFTTTGDKFSYDYQLFPSGLLSKPVFEIRKPKAVN